MARVAFVVLAISLTGTAVVKQGNQSEPKQVHAEGCVEQGVEAGCMVVKDVKSGVVYNILIKGKRPSAGDGIVFTAVPHDGVTHCMQGTAVEVFNWTPKSSLHCTHGEPPNK